MTLQEINAWVEGTPIITWEEDSYDESGNRYESRIYKKNGKFYRLELSNGHPYEQYVKGKGYVRGCYVAPVEVFKKTRVITETHYETEEEAKAHDEHLRLSGQLLEGEGAVQAITALGRFVGNS